MQLRSSVTGSRASVTTIRGGGRGQGSKQRRDASPSVLLLRICILVEVSGSCMRFPTRSSVFRHSSSSSLLHSSKADPFAHIGTGLSAAQIPAKGLPS